MKMEQYHDTLTDSDVRQGFGVLGIDSQGAFHVRDRPVPGDVVRVRVRRSNGLECDLHGQPFPFVSAVFIATAAV